MSTQDNEWPFDAQNTDEQLAKWRQDMLAALDGHGDGHCLITCDGCCMVKECALAFDLYNTDGDCLAEK